VEHIYEGLSSNVYEVASKCVFPSKSLSFEVTVLVPLPLSLSHDMPEAIHVHLMKFQVLMAVSMKMREPSWI
jgi:hypothetical protein